MDSKNCTSCNKLTGCVVLAQYQNGEDHSAYICSDCYHYGNRCWVLEDGQLVVQHEQPPNSKKAILYWDEGGYATNFHDVATYDGGRVVTYPEIVQPEHRDEKIVLYLKSPKDVKTLYNRLRLASEECHDIGESENETMFADLEKQVREQFQK